MRKFAQVWPAVYPLSLLIVPFISTQVTDQVVWSFGDFIVAAILLSGSASCYQWVSQRSGDRFPYQIATALAMVASLLLVWANLAVGLIGNPSANHNLVFFAVIFVGVIGTMWSKRHPKGMSLTTLTMATVLFIITLILNLQQSQLHPQIQFSTLFCLSIVALYTLASWLFHRSAFILNSRSA